MVRKIDVNDWIPFLVTSDRRKLDYIEAYSFETFEECVEEELTNVFGKDMSHIADQVVVQLSNGRYAIDEKMFDDIVYM